MKIGYARVSTEDQNLDLQLTALKADGCERIYQEHESGTNDSREQLAECLAYAREGDTVVVWRLDRLARSMEHLIRISNGLRKRGVHFRCLNPGLDTSGAEGRLFFGIMAAFAEFERELIVHRTRAGMAAAKAAGKTIGRPRVPIATRKRAASLLAAGMSIADVGRWLGLGRSTIKGIRGEPASLMLPEDQAELDRVGIAKPGRPRRNDK